MSNKQPPVAGYWYADVTGRLIQVRLVLYRGKKMSRIGLDYGNGHRVFARIEDWYNLDLVLHSPRRAVRKRRARDV